MLLSMTGFGEARHRDERMSVSVEVRTVNNRYLKLSTKCPDIYGAFEGEIDKIVREFVSRGTVMVSVRVERVSNPNDIRISDTSIEAYWKQLQALSAKNDDAPVGQLSDLLSLPNIIIDESARNIDLDADWEIIRSQLRSALKNLEQFRQDEGRSMHEDLQKQAQEIGDQLTQVRQRAPEVVNEFRTKILDRVQKTLEATTAKVEPADLIRDVSIFVDKADINEEITRLDCHLDQFTTFLNEKGSTGRKLEFLSQEMFREINTIGSKANDVTIAHCVVEMKASIEKIREMLQNVE